MFSLLTEEHKVHLKRIRGLIQKSDNPAKNSANQLIAQLFEQMSLSEIRHHNDRYWTNVSFDFIRFIAGCKSKRLCVNVFNPDEETHGYSDPSISVIQLYNKNVPFLVDSVTLACADQGLDIALISHPVVAIDTHENGERTIVKANESGLEHKSIIYIEVNRIKTKAKLKRIKEKLEQVLSQVHRVVMDWQPMIKALDRASKRIGDLQDDHTRRMQQDYLSWLKNNNFTFLGYRKYDRVKGRMVADADSGLGLFNLKFDADKDYDVSDIPVSGYQVGKQSDLVLISKTNVRSQVHREGNLDYVGVLETDADGQIVSEHRFFGLYTSAAVNTRPWDIPYISEKVTAISQRFQYDENSHSGKRILHILESLPRDELLQTNREELFATIYHILTIEERKSSHIIPRRDKFGRFFSFLVYIPRDKFNTNVRHHIQDLLSEAVHGCDVEFSVSIDEGKLARLYVMVFVDRPDVAMPEVDVLESAVANVIKDWRDELEDTLLEKHGADTGQALANRFANAFPLAYTEEVSPWVASFDVENAARLEKDGDLRMSLYRPRVQEDGKFRFKVFRHGHTIPLSRVLPILENLGLHVVSERPYELRFADEESIWIQDLDLALAGGRELELALVRDRFHAAFEQIVKGRTESDKLNQLLIYGGLDWREITLMRALIKYLLQTGLPYSKTYLQRALINHPHISRWVIELFKFKFDPDFDRLDDATIKDKLADLKTRYQRQIEHLDVSLNQLQMSNLENFFNSRKFSRERLTNKIISIIGALLDSVSSQDEDKIIRYTVDTVRAVLRSNYFQTDADGAFKDYISLKIDSGQLPFLPKPVPYREIFVYSPRVEAIHLRMGPVARGGLRWSDRYEDFRTEVLGLMKAQNVKNSIIVPVGSKGGFVVKKMPPKHDREAVQKEVVACYQSFIRGMLDITDNIVANDIVPPPQVVRGDGDDPYLVVAADKGTATFSDIANSLSLDYGFWLGDAFASGGSAGYDHKGMGITAKGAWESVKRHFRELGVDCQSEDFSVVGIGDMMGDVFGNGMLLSKHICLKAAFNHMHIFIDPTPDAAATWKERKRLFDLPRSTWEDYNTALISSGGGVYSRFDKSIPITPEVKAWLNIRESELPPQDLIKRILLAEVDLIWNGGIGTYVKAQDESHAEVGDSANNVLRVDGGQLKCRVFGEGGNLGMTQKGRIEFAAKGGKVNTDFIDNSAGVDCSDHEVNIKILLKAMAEDGLMNEKERNKLLASMTDNVSALVLRNNYLQTQALSMMEALTVDRIGAKAHLIRVFEQKGLLDRQLEFLPSDSELQRRQQDGEGLLRPELCVLLSYSKLDLYKQLIDSAAINDPWFERTLVNYFPPKLRKTEAQYFQQHRLKNPIIATLVTSKIIDHMGATFVQRMLEDTSANAGAIAKAFYVVVELFDIDALWHAIEQHDLKVDAMAQTQARITIWQFIRQAVRWILNNVGHELDIRAVIDAHRNGIKTFMANLEKYLSNADATRKLREQKALQKQGFASQVAEQIACLNQYSPALDVVSASQRVEARVNDVANLYFQLGDTLKLLWLQKTVESLPVKNNWHVHARGGLRDDLLAHHANLTEKLIRRYGTSSQPEKIIQKWVKEFNDEFIASQKMMRLIRHDKSFDYATLMVAVNSLNNLASSIA